MRLHFSEAEFADRRTHTVKGLTERGLHGMLMFRQESMYYLTGYETFGYVFFQCLYLGADGRVTLLTRAPDRRLAEYTSTIKDIRVWVDSPEAQPALLLRDILREHRCQGQKLGVEWDAYGLTGANARKLSAALDGFCTLEDVSDLVTRQRVKKSPAEIAYVRRAAELADDALAAAIKITRPGTFDGEILAAMQGAVFSGDGDYSGNEFIIGSGPAAHLGRYFSGRRYLERGDQLTLEFAGVYRRYHSCLMRTLTVGKATPRQVDMQKVALDALAACSEVLKPGNQVGDVFAAYLKTLQKGGYADDHLNACGYSLGTTFAPNWMDWPMFYKDNPVIVEPGMVFFMHMYISYPDTSVAPGETYLVTDKGSERLGRAPITLSTE